MKLDNLTPADLSSHIGTMDAAKLISVDDQTKAVNRIRDWKRRGLLTPIGLDQHGRPLYRIIDILRIEQRMRHRR